MSFSWAVAHLPGEFWFTASSIPAMLLAMALLLALLRQAAAEMEVTLAEAMPGPLLPPCENKEIPLEEECPSSFWLQYSPRLWDARGELFSEGVAAAGTSLQQLLREATTPFWEAFACPAAVVSTFFSLARVLVMERRLRRALAMIHLGFIFVRDKGFSECSTWPAQGWDVMLAGQGLTEVVRQLDDESVDSTVPASLRLNLRVAVVTICAYAEDAPVRILCHQNRQLYKLLHGYDVHFFTNASQIDINVDSQMDVNDGVHKPFFWKVNAVKNVLDTGNYDWVLWMDCDAFFMDPKRTIDSVIAMYSQNLTVASRLPEELSQDPEHAALRAASTGEVSLIFAVDSTGINNGVWLLKNTDWSHRFLERWWRSDILQGPGKEHNCSDQSTMLHTLLYDRAMQFDETWDSFELPIYPLEVRVARQEHLQSFHAATAQSALSRAWQDGDFIKHHPGCHYYKVPCQHLYQEAQARTLAGDLLEQGHQEEWHGRSGEVLERRETHGQDLQGGTFCEPQNSWDLWMPWVDELLRRGVSSSVNEDPGFTRKFRRTTCQLGCVFVKGEVQVAS
eukprot:s1919_g13.t1